MLSEKGGPCTGLQVTDFQPGSVAGSLRQASDYIPEGSSTVFYSHRAGMGRREEGSALPLQALRDPDF